MSAVIAAVNMAFDCDNDANDAFDTFPAGRFACAECADNRENAERLQLQLAKANSLLRLLRRIEPKPARAEGIDDDPADLAIIGHAVALATIRARIDLYFAAART